MRNSRFTKLLLLTLICTLVISAPISVTAKSKKIGKPLMDIRAFTAFNDDKDLVNTVYCQGDCKRAKKVEFYRASTKSGKYKKVVTVKNGRSKHPKHKNGLYFYKARGINGDRKGKFCKTEAVYNVDVRIESFEIDKADRDIIVKYYVDNRGSKNSLIFTDNNGAPELSALLALDEDRTNIKGINLKGKYVSEGGDYIFNEVAKDSTGYVNVRYRGLYLNSEYTEAEKDQLMDYVERALKAALESKIEYGYNVSVFLPFSVKSKGKIYDFSSQIKMEDSHYEGTTFPEHY